jgi:hypothetical protein
MNVSLESLRFDNDYKSRRDQAQDLMTAASPNMVGWIDSM